MSRQPDDKDWQEEYMHRQQVEIDDLKRRLDDKVKLTKFTDKANSQLATENNELKAMVNALRTIATGYAKDRHEDGIKGCCYNDAQLERDLYAIGKSPKQCLANVKADAIDEFAMHIGLTGKALSNYVNKLRQTTSSNNSPQSTK